MCVFTCLVNRKWYFLNRKWKTISNCFKIHISEIYNLRNFLAYCMTSMESVGCQWASKSYKTILIDSKWLELKSKKDRVEKIFIQKIEKTRVWLTRCDRTGTFNNFEMIWSDFLMDPKHADKLFRTKSSSNELLNGNFV